MILCKASTWKKNYSSWWYDARVDCQPFVTLLLEVSAVPVLRYVQPVRHKVQLPLWSTPVQWRLHCLRKASASADFWAKRYRPCGRRLLGHSQGQPMPWSCHISYRNFLCPCSNSNMKGFLFHHRLETFMQRQSTELYWYPHHLVVNGNMAMSLA